MEFVKESSVLLVISIVLVLRVVYGLLSSSNDAHHRGGSYTNTFQVLGIRLNTDGR